MGTVIKISPLKKSDIPAVLEIEKQSQPEPWTEQSFLEETGRLYSYLLAARAARGGEPGEDVPAPPAGGILGYICYWCVADEIQILNIAVHKDFRRRGIARAMLEHAIRTGCEKKARTATLEVRRSNIAARRLYKSFGFRQVGERPNYYGVGREPAVLMEFEIPE